MGTGGACAKCGVAGSRLCRRRQLNGHEHRRRRCARRMTGGSKQRPCPAQQARSSTARWRSRSSGGGSGGGSGEGGGTVAACVEHWNLVYGRRAQLVLARASRTRAFRAPRREQRARPRWLLDAARCDRPAAPGGGLAAPGASRSCATGSRAVARRRRRLDTGSGADADTGDGLDCRRELGRDLRRCCRDGGRGSGKDGLGLSSARRPRSSRVDSAAAAISRPLPRRRSRKWRCRCW